MADYRVLVTGSRAWADNPAVYEALDVILAEHDVLTIVHGGARGADSIAHNWALSKRFGDYSVAVTSEPHMADWSKHGKRAGFARNEEMVAAGADVCLAFAMPCELAGCRGKPAHDTHGTGHCIRKAREAGIEIRRFDG